MGPHLDVVVDGESPVPRELFLGQISRKLERHGWIPVPTIPRAPSTPKLAWTGRDYRPPAGNKPIDESLE
jgi:hypothetical protein